MIALSIGDWPRPRLHRQWAGELWTAREGDLQAWLNSRHMSPKPEARWLKAGFSQLAAARSASKRGLRRYRRGVFNRERNGPSALARRTVATRCCRFASARELFSDDRLPINPP